MLFGFFDAQQTRAFKGFGTALRGLDVPALGRKKRLRIGAVGQDFEPALDAPGIKNATYLDGVVG